jgi:Fic family protein
MFIWQRPNWPAFEWDDGKLLVALSDVRLKQGRLLGRMAMLGFRLQQQANLTVLTEDAVKSSEIEGEMLPRNSVRSSLARRLGLPDAAAAAEPDRRAEGVVDMLLGATQNFRHPLTRDRLCGWQAALFPTGYSGTTKIAVGRWRDDADGPMQVVSGPAGRQKVHFEAVPASAVDDEMARFLVWFNAEAPVEGLLRAGLAHLWFVTIHPFDDGNGRVARAIADLALAQSEGEGLRFYSLSAQIRRQRAGYYDILERTQRGTMDVTAWLLWFVECLGRAIDGADELVAQVLDKARFWQMHGDKPFNERQRLVLNRVLDGFQGKLTAKKWSTLAKVSIATAQRDINDLVDQGVLDRGLAGSKNTSYEIICTRHGAGAVPADGGEGALGV